MDLTTFRNYFGSALAVGKAGQAEFTTPGEFDFSVPRGVFSISCVSVGAGQSGGSTLGRGGAGGDLRYITNLAVVPGEILKVKVGAGGKRTASSTGSAGESSSISRSNGSVVLNARGGGAGGLSTAVGGNVGGGSGGTAGADGQSRGGAGAGGYSGRGGNSSTSATNTRDGFGGGGSAGGNGSTNSDGGGAGGGVGLKGEGASGVAPGVGTPTGGLAGSNGVSGGNGLTGDGLGYGGNGFGIGAGGGGQESGAATNIGGDGGPGGVRIIWGAGRAYPSTRTADE